jgi:hypothetical protein
MGASMIPASRSRPVADPARGQIGAEAPQRDVGAGHQHQPAGPLVQPVDDARTLRSAQRGPVVVARQQRVDQGPGLPPGAGVDDHPRRLVDDHQVAVLVDHGERDRLGRDPRRPAVGDGHRDPVARGQGPAGAGREAVDQHRALAHQAGGHGAGGQQPGLGEEAVQPGLGVLRHDLGRRRGGQLRV